MSKVVDFEKFAKEKNLSPLVRYESMIREVIRDINISIAPALTTNRSYVTLEWKSGNGKMNITFNPATAKGVVNASTNDKHILLDDVQINISDRNRWIGYLFDDNFHE